MTREENIRAILDTCFSESKDEIKEVALKNIMSLSTDTISREDYHNLVIASNDIDRALREYQAKEESGELILVVRCKDCRHANECHKSVQYTRNEPRTVTVGYSPIEWCSRGKRRAE